MITLNQKLNRELNNLQHNVNKLDKFIMDNSVYVTLDKEHKKLLKEQLKAMRLYEKVLAKRLTLLLKQ